MTENKLALPTIKLLLLLLFFFSGFVGLMYELVWIRVLSVIFGKTIGAATIVVSVYMAGLGLGSLYWGRKIDTIKNHLKTFGLLQFGIAISCLLVMAFFVILPQLYRFIYNALHISQTTSLIFIFIVSFLCMLVPTFLMGGTLPVISKCYIQNDREIGRGIGALYTVNTCGGIFGAGLTGYILIGTIGQAQTQITAIMISIVLGGISFLLQSSSERNTHGEEALVTVEYPAGVIKVSLLVAGLSGFCGLAYEILATRVLGIFLLNSTYSFSSILIIFLLGISIGSFIFTKYLSDKKQLLMILAFAQILIGVYIITLSPFFNDIPVILDPLRRNILRISFFKVMLPGLILSSILLLIPAIGMGISFPIVCRLYTSHIQTIGNKVGKIFFVNTLGSITGPLVAGFILIPLLGVSRGIIGIAFITLLLGISLVFFYSDTKQKNMFSIISAGILVFCLLAAYFGITNSRIHPPSIFRSKSHVDAIRYYKETSEGTVIVREDKRTGVRALYVNNNAACGVTYDALHVVKMLGHLPFIVNPALRDVCIIGFGIGITTSAVTRHPVKAIDCIEICPGVKDAASYFSQYNNNIVSHPKVRFIGGDGRNHLLLTKKKYDLISCDPIHPSLGCGNLYTKEYFQLCRNHLTNQGVVTQYLPLHKLSLHEFKSLIKTFASVFPHTSVWLAHSHCVLLGTLQNFSIDFNYLSAFLYRLRDNILFDPYQVATTLFLDNRAINDFTRDAPIHSDNRPFLEFFSPGSQLKENWHINLEAMMKHRIDPMQYILNIKEYDTMARYLLGQELFLTGLLFKNKGKMNEVITYFKKAHDINPENNEICIFYDNEVKRYQRFQKNIK